MAQRSRPTPHHQTPVVADILARDCIGLLTPVPLLTTSHGGRSLHVVAGQIESFAPWAADNGGFGGLVVQLSPCYTLDSDGRTQSLPAAMFKLPQEAATLIASQAGVPWTSLPMTGTSPLNRRLPGINVLISLRPNQRRVSCEVWHLDSLVGFEAPGSRDDT